MESQFLQPPGIVENGDTDKKAVRKLGNGKLQRKRTKINTTSFRH